MTAVAPKRVLVAEDEAIVAMTIEAELSDGGYVVIGPFASCANASAWLESATPDIAVLDHTLSDGPCTDLAQELRRRGVPFVALTGADRRELSDVFDNVPYLEKPADPALLPAILAQLLAGSGDR